MNEKVATRWMKPVAVLLWMLTAGVVLSSIGLLVVQPWYLRRMAFEELGRHGKIEISEDGVTFSINEKEQDRETMHDLAVLLKRVQCTNLFLETCPNLKDISGLEELESLRSLYLINTQVSDLSPLAGLSGLTTLELVFTPVSDLSPLAGLSGLTSLDLRGTQVSDLSPLAGLSGLTKLNLRGRPVSDLSPLAGLRGLTTLYLGDTQVSDLSPLARLSGLTTVSLDGTPVSDLSPLAGLKKLESIHLPKDQEVRIPDSLETVIKRN